MLAGAGGAALLLLLIPVVSNAQDDLPEFRPTPKIELSKDEETALGRETDAKRYLKVALELIESRLKRAESSNESGEHDAMLADLGGFHALIDTTLDRLRTGEARRGKMLDTLKRYEIVLRGYTPRIENIRRDSPEKYDSYITKLLKRVRDNRSRAIEPFYGDAVIPENN
jgi:hypothetical protein